MKKLILAILTACLLFSLCACQKTDNINIEDFSAKHSVMYKESKYVSYYCDFENGILTVDRNTYKDNPASPSGVILVDTETTTYHYTLNGYNSITVNGVTYSYRAYQVAEYESYVDFTTPFLGLSKRWKG